MDTYSITQFEAQAQYADGVFIYLTGGRVHAFQPTAKVNGYLDASIMTAAERAGWLAYCVNTLGYVYGGKAAGHVC